MQISIQLHNYQIKLGNALKLLSQYIEQKQYSSVFVLVDENTEKHCLPKIASINNFKPIKIKSGEQYKTLVTCQKIWDKLFFYNADRNSLLINLGGGVIGDMGGFCASTYKRGFDFIQMPTTLLSQVDASIGGKLGIDYNQLKNSIGLFKNPQQVIIDTDFLATLPNKQLLSGFAEVIKHALIDSVEHWQSISNFNFDNGDINQLIYQSLLIKKQIVETDPFEKNVRQALNLGHSIGHAIESFSLENDNAPLLHGEAIAIGLLIENFIAQQILNFPKTESEQIQNFILKHYQYYPINNHKIIAILSYLLNDKKNKGSVIKMSLLQNIGRVKVGVTVQQNHIKMAIKSYQNIMP